MSSTITTTATGRKMIGRAKIDLRQDISDDADFEDDFGFYSDQYLSDDEYEFEEYYQLMQNDPETHFDYDRGGESRDYDLKLGKDEEKAADDYDAKLDDGDDDYDACLDDGEQDEYSIHQNIYGFPYHDSAEAFSSNDVEVDETNDNTILTENDTWNAAEVLPPMSEILSQLKGTEGRLATFYVNLGKCDSNMRQLRRNKHSKIVKWLNINGYAGIYYWWDNVNDHNWLRSWSRYLGENRNFIEYHYPHLHNPRKIFTKGVSQAMALAAQQADVVFFTPNDQSWNDDTIWQEVEFPTLTQNPNVQRIFRVDPRSPTNTPFIMWNRTEGDEILPTLFEYPNME